MDTTITDDSDTTITSKTTSDSDSTTMSSVFDLDAEFDFDGIGKNSTAILESVKEIDKQALQNYGILICAFALLLGCSIVDLDNTITLIIDVTAIRRYEWAAIELTINREETNRTIDDLGPMCYHLTRFTREEL